MAALKRTEPCPCGSGAPYGDCCRVAIEEGREPPTPEGLMRSRYVAFATGAVPYLVRTLHAQHADHALGAARLEAALRDVVRGRRLLGLSVLEASPPTGGGEGATAQVLFYVRAFEKGRDVSFVELSDFSHNGVGWRYRDGAALPATRATVAGAPVAALTIDGFLRLERP